MQLAKTLILCSFLSIGFSQEYLSGPHSSKLDVRHLEYQGIGYNEGYSTMQLFLANSEDWTENNIFFLDVRGHVFNNGKPAANAGIGWRYLLDSRCQAFGINTYYDYRKTKRKAYNQVGCGLEYLTPSWEFRANGYFPLGARKSYFFDPQFAGFTGNNFFVSRKHEFSMMGGDAEAGWHFVHSSNVDLFAAAGPYYFNGPLGKSAIGGKLRIEARLTPYVTLEVADSYDAVFHNRFHAELTLSIPFGPRSVPRSDKCCSCDDQIALQQWLHDAPNRAEIIVVDKKKKTSLGLDPVTGLPLFFIFVNNTSSSNGTFESPFPTFALAAAASKPGDVIYVFPGDGTTTGMNAGITLKENQRFLGAGIEHSFLTQFGELAIPAQANRMPSITSAVSPIVRMVPGTEVSGFNFVGTNAGVNGIRTDLTDQFANLTIDRNIFTAPMDSAIRMIHDNVVGDIVIGQNSFNSHDDNGINISNTGLNDPRLNILIEQNSFFNCGFNGLGAIGIGTGGTAINVISIIENSILATLPMNIGNHIETTHFGGVQIFQISGNTFQSPLNATYSSILMDVSTSLPLEFTDITISDNMITGARGGIVIGHAGGNMNLNISRNSIQDVVSSAGALHSIHCTLSATADVTGTISENIIDQRNLTGPLGIGISILESVTGSTRLNIANNTLTRMRDRAMEIETNGDDVVLDLKGNAVAFTRNPDAIYLNPAGGNLRAHVSQNIFQNNALEDFLAETSAGASVCLSLENNSAPLGYTLDNSVGATFNLEPPRENEGTITTIGTITSVPLGSCD